MAKSMGMIVEPRCAYGYKSSSEVFGAGMRDFTTSCRVPAACDTCRTIVTVDYLAAEQRCPVCSGPVSGSAVSAPTTCGLHWPLPSGDAVWLPHGGNACPACGSYALEFSLTGFFD